MKSIFSAKLNAIVRPNDILVKAPKPAPFGDKSLRLGPKTWNTLPKNIKAENSMLNIRNLLQHGLGLNANVRYAVSITVKTKSLSNQLKIFSYFNVNPFTTVYYFFIFVNFKLIVRE